MNEKKKYRKKEKKKGGGTLPLKEINKRGSTSMLWAIHTSSISNGDIESNF